MSAVFLTEVVEGRNERNHGDLQLVPCGRRSARKSSKPHAARTSGTLFDAETALVAPRPEYGRLLFETCALEEGVAPLVELQGMIRRTRKNLDAQRETLDRLMSDVEKLGGGDRSKKPPPPRALSQGERRLSLGGPGATSRQVALRSAPPPDPRREMLELCRLGSHCEATAAHMPPNAALQASEQRPRPQALRSGRSLTAPSCTSATARALLAAQSTTRCRPVSAPAGSRVARHKIIAESAQNP